MRFKTSIVLLSLACLAKAERWTALKEAFLGRADSRILIPTIAGRVDVR